jgi:hypothetical protein
VGFAAAAAIAITSFFGTGAAHRGQAPTAVVRPPAATANPIGRGDADETAAATAVPPAAEAILADTATPETPVSELSSPEERALVRRLRIGRKAGSDRPVSTIAPAPVHRSARPALAPDEDATLPPSDL